MRTERVIQLRRGRTPRAREGGFTLLEVLLAFVVFALSFATVLEILSGSLRSTVRAQNYSEAALLAQSLMDMVGTEVPLEDSVHEGESDGGIRWQIDISGYVPPSGDDHILQLAEANGTLLYRVEVTLEWGEEPRARNARFSTVRSILDGRGP